MAPLGASRKLTGNGGESGRRWECVRRPVAAHLGDRGPDRRGGRGGGAPLSRDFPPLVLYLITLFIFFYQQLIRDLCPFCRVFLFMSSLRGNPILRLPLRLNAPGCGKVQYHPLC